jgi:uncharacterized protein YndB with AHSA1/START domain
MTVFKTTRELPVAPATVFAAFADPTRLAKWWGPDGFTNQFETFEFTPGGRWVFTMIGPDCATYPNEAVFSSIEPYNRVVIQHVSQPHFTLTITIEASSNGTLLTWEQAFADASVARAIRHIVEPANEQNLDRMAREVRSCDSPAA